jgi:hypothetical protein
LTFGSSRRGLARDMTVYVLETYFPALFGEGGEVFVYAR